MGEKPELRSFIPARKGKLRPIPKTGPRKREEKLEVIKFTREKKNAI